MVEYNIHSILRAQKDKPVEIDQFDVSLLGGGWFLLCIWAWGMGYSYGEVLVKWWTK